MQPQINTQEMHELPETERQRERREDGKWKGNISIGDNTRIRREQTKCWSNLFLLKCQLMLSAFCGFYHSNLPFSKPPAPIIHYSCWALARLFWAGASCPCWRFLLYVLFVVFHRCFGIKLNSREISLRDLPQCVCACVCVIILWHMAKKKQKSPGSKFHP